MAGVLFGTFATMLSGADLSEYRGFRIGMDLPAVARHAGMDPSRRTNHDPSFRVVRILQAVERHRAMAGSSIRAQLGPCIVSPSVLARRYFMAIGWPRRNRNNRGGTPQYRGTAAAGPGTRLAGCGRGTRQGRQSSPLNQPNYRPPVFTVALRNYAPAYERVFGFIVATGAVLVAIQATRARKYRWVAGLYAIAIAFNPVVPLGVFSGSCGLAIVVGALALFAFSTHMLKTQPLMSMASTTDRNPGSRSL